LAKKGMEMQTRLDRFGRVSSQNRLDKIWAKTGRNHAIGGRRRKIILKPESNVESLKLKDGVLVFSGKIEGDITNTIKERIKRIRHLAP